MCPIGPIPGRSRRGPRRDGQRPAPCTAAALASSFTCCRSYRCRREPRVRPPDGRPGCGTASRRRSRDRPGGRGAGDFRPVRGDPTALGTGRSAGGDARLVVHARKATAHQLADPLRSRMTRVLDRREAARRPATPPPWRGGPDGGRRGQGLRLRPVGDANRPAARPAWSRAGQAPGRDRRHLGTKGGPHEGRGEAAPNCAVPLAPVHR